MAVRSRTTDRPFRSHEALLVGLLLVVGLGLAACTSEGASEATGASDEADTVRTAAAATPPDSARVPPRPVPDGDRPLAQKLDDARLAAQAKRALVQQRRLRVFDLRPVATAGRIVLRGDVNTADQYRAAERAVRRVNGVEAVVNELTIGGEPVTDERLQALSGSDPAEKDDASAVYHTVRRGESLWRIAREYGTSIRRLRSLNDLRADGLQPGQRIRVR